MLVAACSFLKPTLTYADEDIAPLIVACSNQWQPFCFSDNDGNPQGLLIDYWRLYGQTNHVDISFKLTSWSKSLDLLKTGRADIHAGLLETDERRQYLTFVGTTVPISAYIYTSQAMLKHNIEEHLNNGGSIGGIKSSYEISYVRNRYNNAKVYEFETTEELLRSIDNGTIDAFTADVYDMNYYLNNTNKIGEYTPNVMLYERRLQAAVSHLRPELVPHVRTGMANINSADIHHISSRWVSVTGGYPKYTWPVVGVLLVLTIIVYIVSLNITVKRRTRQLRRLNSELHEQAHTDVLTGIHNRRSFTKALKTTCATDKASKTLLMMDIDHFKKINDLFGHTSGDDVICHIANIIRECAPTNAHVSRIGGEEFCVLIEGMSQTDAKALSKFVCERARSSNIETLGQWINATLSVGCVHIDNGVINPDEMLKRADVLMYRAKNQGRDQYQYETLLVHDAHA